MKEQIEAVQRMQDYIREHIYDRITLADLAVWMVTNGHFVVNLAVILMSMHRVLSLCICLLLTE